MHYMKKILVLAGISLVSACSNATPELVSGLGKLNIPVVQRTSSAPSPDERKVAAVYSDNERIIAELTALLKSRYLSDARPKDMFDVHSLSHEVYKSLTSLEQAGEINTQYYAEQNMAGLNKLNSALRPFEQETL